MSSPFSIFSPLGQIEFAIYLQMEADSFYDSNYQPRSSLTEKLTYQRLATDPLPHVEAGLVPDVNNWLLELGVTEFAKYKGGQSADLLVARTHTGKVAAIRVPKVLGEFVDHVRIKHPAVWQPFPGGVFPLKGDAAIEVLPLGHVIGIREIENPKTFNTSILFGEPLLSIMHRLSGLKGTHGMRNDLGLLPDGTPLPVDPDILKFIRGPQSSGEMLDCRAQILRHHPYMESVFWTTEDGKSKQELFFPDDYLTTPLIPESKPVLLGKPQTPRSP